MQNPRLNYTVVGTFVLLVAIGIVTAVAALSGRAGPTDRYVTVYGNVHGLKYGTQVTFEGYPVGQVERVEPFADQGRMRFRIEMSIARGWPIPVDSVAQVAAAGLLAAMTIDIRAGDSAETVPPGGTLTGGEAADIFKAMSSVAAEMTSLSEHTVKPFLRQLGGTVGQLGTLLEGDASAIAGSLRRLVDDLHTRIPEITGGVRQLVEDLGRRVPEVTDQVARLMVRLDRAGSHLEELLNDTNRQRVAATLEYFEQTGAGFSRLLETLDLTRAELDALVNDLRGVLLTSGPEVRQSSKELEHVATTLASHIDAISANISAASRNFNEFSREIRQNPGLLLGGKPPRDEAAR